MRIPVPVHFKIKHAIIFSATIFILQQIAGTSLDFSLLFAMFVVLSTLAFNTAGGLAYPSGSFIFFFAVLTSIAGVTYKAFLFEPAESNLHSPLVTMGLYCASMAVFWLAVFVTRRIAPKQGLLAGLELGQSMRKAAIGALFLGFGLQILAYFPQEPGSFLAALRQINEFSLVAILLATFSEVKASGGRRSSNWIVWTGVISNVVLGGMISFSKQGFLSAPLAWLAAAIAAGHNFSRKQLLGILLAGFFFKAYLVPYSQVGRDLRDQDNPSLADQWRVAKQLIPMLGTVRSDYESQSELAAQVEIDNSFRFFDRPQGFMDRLNMIAPDDALVTYSLEGNYEGISPTLFGFMSVVPHFIWANKPYFYSGNEYGREIGIIASDDTTTGISFSPSADVFHQIGWYGLLVLGGVLFIMFMTMDSLSGDVRLSPWGLLFVVVCAHNAPEGLIEGQIYTATYVAFGVTVVALVTRYALPVVSGVLTNTERTRVRKTTDFGPGRLIPRRLHESPVTPPQDL